ncbi:YigZ family protein [Leucobacter sp. BZR 635]
MAAEYETIAGPINTEIEISRSRFLTRLERVDSEEAARAVIAEVRAEHPRARHHCSAFVLGSDGRVQRSNDDGEPGGTAGAPMLDALVSAGLSDVVAVVTRYFGGVLLGAGGLTRAYRASVAGAVLDAERVRRGLRTEVAVEASYEVAAQIEAEARRRGYAVGEADYGAAVIQRFAVAVEEIPQLAALAAELSAGAAVVVPGEARYVDLPST